MRIIVKFLFYTVITVVALFVVLFILVLPELIIKGMDWLAIYIGKLMTWILFIGAIVLFIKLCNYYGNK